jgi:hypothetical protein
VKLSEVDGKKPKNMVLFFKEASKNRKILYDSVAFS